MGKLLDKVLEINKNNFKVIETKIKTEIDNINNAIINAANHNNVSLEIKFIDPKIEISKTMNPLYTDLYVCSIENNLYKDLLKKYIQIYYEKEKFEVINSDNDKYIKISWYEELKNNLEVYSHDN